MIFEGSCDTEEWSKDAENSAVIKQCNILQNYFFYFIFYLEKCWIGEHDRQPNVYSMFAHSTGSNPSKSL